MRLGHKAKVSLIGACAIFVALIATAFAVGGSGTSPRASNTASLVRTEPVVAGAQGALPALRSTAGHRPAVVGAPPPAAASVPDTAPLAANGPTAQEYASAPSAGGGRAAAGGSTAADSSAPAHSGSTIAATRIVKTGNLTIRVDKRDVQSVTQALTSLATSQGGYVSQSNTNLGSGAPYGEVVLRIPVAHFQDAINAAEKLGQHVVSLTTSADDVTGRYVDLTAKMHALERTRSTYLSILSRARTIGATLAVQQRIDDVQQQIDQLHGQIKLLGNQSSYSTLTVDVVPAGGVVPLHHATTRHGIGKAWHDSWSRFGRGVNAIVGAIGPIVFAVLFLAVLGLIGLAGYRGYRRLTGGSHAAA